MRSSRKQNVGSLFDSMTTWQFEQFPKARPSSVLAHLRKEFEELEVNPSDPSEIADMVILLNALAVVQGIDLIQAVREKMAINMQRQWGEPDAEGVVEHVRD